MLKESPLDAEQAEWECVNEINGPWGSTGLIEMG